MRVANMRQQRKAQRGKTERAESMAHNALMKKKLQEVSLLFLCENISVNLSSPAAANASADNART